MCRSKIIAVTDRKLSRRDFLQQIGRIAAAKPGAIILREKDLPAEAYEQLARRVKAVCDEYKVACILHSFVQTARNLGCDKIQLPFAVWQRESGALRDFDAVGVSVHSLPEAVAAEALGASYLLAGHIFATACKPNLAPRGLDFLAVVSRAVSIPVYAIGGINAANAGGAVRVGARGVCVMSGLMAADDPGEYCDRLRRSLQVAENMEREEHEDRKG